MSAGAQSSIEERPVSLGAEWSHWFCASQAEAQLALALHLGDSAADCAVHHYLTRLGAFVASVVPRKSETRLAPGFDFANDGSPALVLPVRGTGDISFTFECGWEPPLTTAADVLFERFLFGTSDFVALPLDGSRPLSYRGFTAAVGEFAADDTGRVTVNASGRAWIEAQLAIVRRLAAERPPHIAAREAGQPEERATLLVDPKAFDWTGVVAPKARYALPHHAKTLVVADSRGLAEALDKAMHAPVKRIERPKILAPKAPKGGAA